MMYPTHTPKEAITRCIIFTDYPDLKNPNYRAQNKTPVQMHALADE